MVVKRYIIDNVDLMTEWDWEKNSEIDFYPNELTCGSHKKAWWKCINGHVWQASIANRNNGNGCPYCSGQRLIQGESDLASNDTFLTQEWLINENLPLTPQTVFWKSNKKVWWQCSSCGNKWQAKVVNRVYGRGCPKCYSRNQTSFPEQAIFYYISRNFPDAINRFKDPMLDGMELDVYIPSRKIAIEYDGIAWHTSLRSKQREKKKYLLCKNNGILLIRIKELIDEESQNCDVLIPTKYNHLDFEELDRVIKLLITYLYLDLDINTKRDKTFIQQQFFVKKKKNSVLCLYPKIAATWNTKKNGVLTPDMFSPGSTDHVWWICPDCGYEWQARIDHRCSVSGCPKCSISNVYKTRNKKYIEKNGSLAENYPHVAYEWHPTKNDELTPYDVLSGSNKKVWWQGQCGHEWQSVIASRTKIGVGCPICSGRQILTGYNDLATINPELLEEWDYEKNEYDPTQMSPNSHKKAWWRCKFGHSWEAQIKSRNHGCGCPICGRRKSREV